jgi:molybdenum cofactor cytidylyltransferase
MNRSDIAEKKAGNIAAVILAAGESRRFAGLKQLALWHGRPLVRHCVEVVAACPDIAKVYVTVGCRAEDVVMAIGEGKANLVPVPDWAAGQSRSVQLGLGAVLGPENAALGLEACIFLMVDQPGVTPALLSALAQRRRETHALVVVPRYGGRRGTPVIFARALWPEFDELSGDSGARSIIDRHLSDTAWLDWPDPQAGADIDTWDDYLANQR